MPLRPLLVLGSINADLYLEIDRLPLPGETIAGRGAAVRPGGKGANQAAAAARLGCPTCFAGQIGLDAYGSDLQAALAATGADTRWLRRVPGPSGQALILLQAGGQNSIVVVGGANQAWDRLDPGLEEAISQAGCLLMQCEIPIALVQAAAGRARQAGVPVVLDAGGLDGRLPDGLWPLVEVFSPNESELASLVGCDTSHEAGLLAAARRLLDHGVRQVLIKLGARGSLLVGPGTQVLRQAIFPVDVVDTTGAGDCFTAAFTVARLEGRSDPQVLRFASAAAALCVTGKGALPSMPLRAQVEDFLARAS